MCIICNCNEKGDEFLMDHFSARVAMKKAIKSMEACYDVSNMKKYRKAQYKMVRILREWNRIEENREEVVS